MALITQLGLLDQLDLESEDTLQSLLEYDKHQMLEGLIVEGYFEKYVEMLEVEGAATIQASLVKSIFRTNLGSWKKPAWWLWSHNGNHPLADQLRNHLAARHTIIDCHFDNSVSDFILSQYSGKSINSPAQAWMMAKRRMSRLDFETPSLQVSDKGRYMQAFWGGLKSIHGKNMYRDVVLPRLFKNCVIAPFFSAVWDVDRIVQFATTALMQMEVKHKYPFLRDGGLYFGINEGQLKLMRDLAECGIDTLHLIIVKPKWTDAISTGYLLQDPSIRPRILLIGYKLDLGRIKKLLAKSAITSSSKTAFYGRGKLSFIPIPVENFHLIGTLDDPLVEICSRIQALASDKYSEPVSKSLLEAARLSEDC